MCQCKIPLFFNQIFIEIFVHWHNYLSNLWFHLQLLEKKNLNYRLMTILMILWACELNILTSDHTNYHHLLRFCVRILWIRTEVTREMHAWPYFILNLCTFVLINLMHAMKHSQIENFLIMWFAASIQPLFTTW